MVLTEVLAVVLDRNEPMIRLMRMSVRGDPLKVCDEILAQTKVFANATLLEF